MSGPNERQFGVNRPYRRRFPDPRQWPSNVVFGLYAETKTEKDVNELSWEQTGHEVAAEIEQVLAGEAPMPPPVGRPPRKRRGEPGE